MFKANRFIYNLLIDNVKNNYSYDIFLSALSIELANLPYLHLDALINTIMYNEQHELLRDILNINELLSIWKNKYPSIYQIIIDKLVNEINKDILKLSGLDTCLYLSNLKAKNRIEWLLSMPIQFEQILGYFKINEHQAYEQLLNYLPKESKDYYESIDGARKLDQSI